MQFKKLTAEDLPALREFFALQTTRMSVYSGAYQFLWRIDYFKPDYAIVGQCLVFKSERKGEPRFTYPLSKSGDGAEESAALAEIEKYCRNNYISLRYFGVPESRLPLLIGRYSAGIRIDSDRTWSEYLYKIEDFRSFPGKKMSGQRNHVNKFYRNYPDAAFKVFRPGDEGKILDFLSVFEETEFTKSDGMAKIEMDAVKSLIPRLSDLSQVCGYMEVGGKIISVAAGEICGDTLVEHVEKALKEYEGVYPATAQAFARSFGGEGVSYINREDDSGDLGLRKSKLQYNPCALLRSYAVSVDKMLKKVHTMPVIKGKNVILKRIADKDAERYRALAADVERNKFWGYDYRKDLPLGQEADGAYFLSLIRRDFRNRNELSLGIYLQGELIGEAVVHNCGYAGEAEVGVRVLPGYEGRGYAGEAIKLLIEFSFASLGAEVVQAKCYKQNTRSNRMLSLAGMRPCGEDDTFYYFRRTPAM